MRCFWFENLCARSSKIVVIFHSVPLLLSCFTTLSHSRAPVVSEFQLFSCSKFRKIITINILLVKFFFFWCDGDGFDCYVWAFRSGKRIRNTRWQAWGDFQKLFGFREQSFDFQFINGLLLWARFSAYRCKLSNPKPDMLLFFTAIHLDKNSEYVINSKM